MTEKQDGDHDKFRLEVPSVTLTLIYVTVTDFHISL